MLFSALRLVTQCENHIIWHSLLGSDALLHCCKWFDANEIMIFFMLTMLFFTWTRDSSTLPMVKRRVLFSHGHHSLQFSADLCHSLLYEWGNWPLNKETTHYLPCLHTLHGHEVWATLLNALCHQFSTQTCVQFCVWELLRRCNRNSSGFTYNAISKEINKRDYTSNIFHQHAHKNQSSPPPKWLNRVQIEWRLQTLSSGSLNRSSETSFH